ncbi:SDR family NAD(P)-dependent oxidoreductase [Ferribacterium limneticum]|uniref:SDR family NAD(P)-dependent oxidoreductase n=1 Tax=Ferribacterium limneticum TaxID=76259 RepID=UPI001CFABC66|nr:SDR family oxidoreductase [Ferribacterium limneticum]UCV17815.1 SDR family oxidoreductase [Ferribacterium limneticum]
MNFQLSGKRALVTGSTTGVGFAIALELAREGAIVTINGSEPERVAAAVEFIRSEVNHAQVHGVTADLANAYGIQSLLRQCPKADILVNSLEIIERAPFEKITDSEWHRIFDVNVLSGVRLVRHYLPRMKATNWGRIVFISDDPGITPSGEMIHHGMTKAAQTAVSHGLAQFMVGTGITVNSIRAGQTLSESVAMVLAKLAPDQEISIADAEPQRAPQMPQTSRSDEIIDPTEVPAEMTCICSPDVAATNDEAQRMVGDAVSSLY